MTQEVPQKPRKDRKNTSFWRATGYLKPYRRMVATSIICAFFVGFISASGLATMLPILRVLINGDTVAGWVNRQIVQQRIGVTLSQQPGRNLTQTNAAHRVVSIAPNSPAARAHLQIGDNLYPVQPLADPAALKAQRAGKTIPLPPLPWYFVAARRGASFLPIRPLPAVATIFGVLVCLAMLGNFFRFFQEYLSDKSAISAVNDVRRHLYDHVLHTRLSYFGASGTSDVTSRLVQDAQGLQDGFKNLLGQAIQEPLKAAFALGLSLLISWKITLFILIFAPLMALVIKKFGKKMRRASRAALQRSSLMLGQIEGTLIGIRVVKSACAERFERRRYAGIIGQLRQEQLKMARYEAWATPAMETVSLLVVGAVLIAATYMVFENPPELSTAGFLAIMACLVSIGESLRRVSKLNSVLQRSNAAAARIFEILDMPIERRRTIAAAGSGQERPQILPPIQREIRFESVAFAYANAKFNAVDEVSLAVQKGKSVAIVGRNGSGKTTLLSLLPRFYDPHSGRITIDGIDIKTVTLRSLRRQISIVTQDPVIFPGTIAQNIAYGDPRAPRHAVIDAAQRAFAHEFIMEKPEGYDAPLDGLGGQLSGGQKQRINIARAIYRASPILVLDEATSQVDAESEHLIQKAIESLMHERTTFVIAHRLGTILSADLIVVMDRGQIVGQGKHEELLTACETYQQLYERQLVGAAG